MDWWKLYTATAEMDVRRSLKPRKFKRQRSQHVPMDLTRLDRRVVLFYFFYCVVTTHREKPSQVEFAASQSVIGGGRQEAKTDDV